jgi:hypothetical protein
MGEIRGVHNLAKQLESRSDSGLRGYDCGKNGDHERRPEHVWRNRQEEGIRVGGRNVGDVGSLADICHEKTWISQTKPRDLNGTKLWSVCYLKNRHIYSHAREKAPKSAKSVSTPVKASRMPPSSFQPEVPLRTNHNPAKYGENALSIVQSCLARFC